MHLLCAPSEPSAFSENLFTDPQVFLTWGFVLLSIPGFILGLLTLISDDKNAGTMREDKLGKWIYRIVGLYVFYLIPVSYTHLTLPTIYSV